MGLAPILVDEIFAFLRRLAAEGSSLLIVEQYVGKVLAQADFVYLLAREGSSLAESRPNWPTATSSPGTWERKPAISAPPSVRRSGLLEEPLIRTGIAQVTLAMGAESV